MKTAGLIVFTAVSLSSVACSESGKQVNPGDPAQVARGRVVYEQRCASCHGVNLEGQPSWRVRMSNGRVPAPPHDDSGHTWHHPDEVLLGIVENGLVPPYAPAGYQSDMPAFGSVLSDGDIRAVLAYIESRWSPEVLKMRKQMLDQQGSGRR
jgi:mono/diheme cytochrome c family protein